MTPPAEPPLPPSGAAGETWSIAEVERETGLGKDTLRVWERRYGFPMPVRDPLGVRAYPHEQVQRLRLIKRLLDAEHRPGKVVPLTEERLLCLLELLPDGTRSADPAPARSADAPPGLDECWMQWVREANGGRLHQALQQRILRNGLGPTVNELVAPLCVLVGKAWMRGEISVYHEHHYTQILQTVLREAIAAVDPAGESPGRRPRVLLTTPPGEEHGLGLLMAECHFALESCQRIVLGTSTPLADVQRAVRELDIDVLALSFSSFCPRRTLLESLRQLRAGLAPAVELWAGGAAAHAHRRSLPEGVVLVRLAGDVPGHVRAWRQSHPEPVRA